MTLKIIYLNLSPILTHHVIKYSTSDISQSKADMETVLTDNIPLIGSLILHT